MTRASAGGSGTGPASDQDLADLISLLHDDHVYAIEVARGALGTGKDQVARRTYVRSAFATIEGTLNAVAGFFVDAFGDELAQAERDELADGRTVSGGFRSLVQRTKDLVGVARPFLAEPIDLGTHGFETFRDAVPIRDRLMHPKHPHALTVSDEEIRVVEEGLDWFRDAMWAVLEAVARQLGTTPPAASQTLPPEC
jgi:hypothetical protein